MKILFSALIALSFLAGAANATPNTAEYGCGYGHNKIQMDSTVGYGCGYGH